MTTLLAVEPERQTSHSATFRNFVVSVRARLDADDIFVVTTLPRGGLQLCLSTSGVSSTASRYGSELHRHDSAAWNAIRNGFSTTGKTPLGETAALLLSVAVDDLVFGGFPAAVILTQKRGSTAPIFDPAVEADEIRKLVANELRPARTGDSVPRRQYIFSGGKSILPEPTPTPTVEAYFNRLRKLATDHSHADATGRQTVADSTGVLTAVQIAHFDHYPALGAEPVMFLSLNPQPSDWEHLTPQAFDADAELARLTRAIGFMTRNFRSGPTLDAIAASVELSQFHFHRRFSDLFGVTPKQVLFDLQLDEAKRLLKDPRKQLVDVAKHCGFAHQSHFTSRFKQGSGVTPTRWRKLSAVQG